MMWIAERWPILQNGPDTGHYVVLLCHGAGAPMDSPFMEAMAGALGALGARVCRFELEYMAARRLGQSKRPPPRMPNLVTQTREFIRAFRAELNPGVKLVGAGKSMGGRMFTHLAVEAPQLLEAAVAFGYPFHPVKKPQVLRTAHLQGLQLPLLVVQGSRDPFGSRSEVTGYSLPAHMCLEWLEAGDHDFNTPRGSSLKQADLIRRGAELCVRFSSSLPQLAPVPSK